MSYALGGLLMLIGLYLLVALLSRVLVQADPRALARGLKWLAAIGLGGLAALLLFTGRAAVLGGIAVMLVPFLRGWFNRAGAWGMGGAGAAGAGGGRDDSRRPPPGFGGGGMTRKEAYDILGLTPGCGPDDIREAHRRLIKAVHPDHGGSALLAARINQARDTLLRG